MILIIFAILISFNIVIADEEVFELEEISVTPGKFSIDENAPSLYTIQKSEMDKLPLIDNDIYRVAHNLPGVASDDYSARFSLRGGDRDEILVKLDGMELYDPYHLQDFGGAISVIDLGIVKHTDLFTGGFPAEYGDAMSGVLDVASGGGVRSRFGGDFGIDLLNTHLILDIPIPKGSWLLSARRGYIDLLMGLIETEEVFKPQYYDIYSKITSNISTKDKLSAYMLYAGDSDIIDQIGENQDIDSKYWNGMTWANWNHLVNDKSYINTYLFAGKAGRNKTEGIDGMDKRSTSYAGLKGDLVYGIGKLQTLKSGIRWQMAQAEYDYYLKEDDAITSIDTDADGWNINGYLQDEVKIGKWIGTNIGLRFMSQSYGEYSSVMPRLALAVKPSGKLTIRSAWGRYYQPVLVTNLPVEEGISESQPPEKATHYILSTEYTPNTNFLIKIEAYYKDLDDLVGRIKDYGKKESLFINQKSGIAKGIELYIRQSPLAKFSWGLGYSLSKSEADTDYGKIPQNYDRRHSLNINADYALFADGWLNVIWRFHTGDPYTPAWYEKVSGSWEKKYGEANSERYPAYHSLDVRLTKNYQFKRFSLSLYLQIMNIYNHKNVHEYSFEEMTDSEGNIYYQKIEEHFLPILPAFGINAQF